MTMGQGWTGSPGKRSRQFVPNIPTSCLYLHILGQPLTGKASSLAFQGKYNINLGSGTKVPEFKYNSISPYLWRNLSITQSFFTLVSSFAKWG
jgi:hypothetical protein